MLVPMVLVEGDQDCHAVEESGGFEISRGAVNLEQGFLEVLINRKRGRTT